MEEDDEDDEDAPKSVQSEEEEEDDEKDDENDEDMQISAQSGDGDKEGWSSNEPFASTHNFS